MKKATKCWHGRTFDQYISKEGPGLGERKNLLKDKFIKTFTNPKKEIQEPLLSDLKWSELPNNKGIWVCEGKNEALNDNTFYPVLNKFGVQKYFCTMNTWENYSNTFGVGCKIENEILPAFAALDKLLQIDYYDEN